MTSPTTTTRVQPMGKRYPTRKNTRDGRATTLERRAIRRAKYGQDR